MVLLISLTLIYGYVILDLWVNIPVCGAEYYFIGIILGLNSVEGNIVPVNANTKRIKSSCLNQKM